MAFVAIGAAFVEGLILGGIIGGTVTVVVGGTIILIKSLVDEHLQKMRRIIRLRDETIRRLQIEIQESARSRNRIEKQLHRHVEIQEVFKVFQIEVEQARKLIEEAEYTNDNGKKIKGFQGKHQSILSPYKRIIVILWYKFLFKHWLQVLGKLKQTK